MGWIEEIMSRMRELAGEWQHDASHRPSELVADSEPVANEVVDGEGRAAQDEISRGAEESLLARERVKMAPKWYPDLAAAREVLGKLGSPDFDADPGVDFGGMVIDAPGHPEFSGICSVFAVQEWWSDEAGSPYDLDQYMAERQDYDVLPEWGLAEDPVHLEWMRRHEAKRPSWETRAKQLDELIRAGVDVIPVRHGQDMYDALDAAHSRVASFERSQGLNYPAVVNAPPVSEASRFIYQDKPRSSLFTGLDRREGQLRSISEVERLMDDHPGSPNRRVDRGYRHHIPEYEFAMVTLAGLKSSGVENIAVGPSRIADWIEAARRVMVECVGATFVSEKSSATLEGIDFEVERIEAFQFRSWRGDVAETDLAIVRDPKVLGAPLVVATEREDNPGVSVTNGAEQLGAALLSEVLSERVGAKRPFILVEHYRAKSFDVGAGDFEGLEPSFKLVVFSSFGVTLNGNGVPKLGAVEAWSPLKSHDGFSDIVKKAVAASESMILPDEMLAKMGRGLSSGRSERQRRPHL